MERYVNTLLEDLNKTVRHHQNIFGVNESISATSYLNLRIQIFELIQIFSSLDEEFAKAELLLLFEDVVTILDYFDKFKLTSEVLKNLYAKKPSTISGSYENFDQLYSKKFKILKMKVIGLINTKLYLLDTFIWKEASKSRSISFFLKQKSPTLITSTKEFFKVSKNKNKVRITYHSINKNVKTLYEPNILNYIKNLPNESEKNTNPLLQKLIASKDTIAFFKGMFDDDMKEIITDINFIKFKKHETILEEFDDSSEIYYLLSGVARVIVGSNALAVIEQGNIFGEFSSITGEKRKATIKANDDKVTVLRFNLNFDLYKSMPYAFTHLFKNVIDSLILKLNNSNTHKIAAEEKMKGNIGRKINEATKHLKTENKAIKILKEAVK